LALSATQKDVKADVIQLPRALTRESAEEYSASIGQIGAGLHRQVRWAERQGIPRLLGLTTPEWVEKYMGGYIKLDAEQRVEAYKEMKAEEPEISNRAMARALGVDPQTVNNDISAENSAPLETDARTINELDAGGAENSAVADSAEPEDSRPLADDSTGQQELIPRPRETETEETSRVRRVALAKNLMNMHLLSQTLAGEKHIEHVAKFLREHPDEFQAIAGMSVSDYLATLKTIRAQADALIKKVKHRG
jgi:hypothetical protein